MEAPQNTKIISHEVWDCFRPRPHVDSKEWIRDNVRMPDGRMFSFEQFPWVDEIIDAYDDPEVRIIALQFASRLGKTALCHALLNKIAATDPVPMMFASSTQEIIKDSMKTKLGRMFELNPELRRQLPVASKRTLYRIDLRDCCIRSAWSGSTSTLADRSIHTLHINEVDKWDTSTSTEGDPVDLAIERTKEFPTRKIFIESTPSLKHRSRIERELESGTNERYYVPCIHCGEYQTIQIGTIVNDDDDKKTSKFRFIEEDGGITWDLTSAGTHNADLAQNTARYVCKFCHGEIHDEHRPAFIRPGTWVPEGHKIDKDGVITGPKRRRGNSRSFQLSSYYALQLTWGDVARQYVGSRRTVREEQNFVNSWAGETFSMNAVARTWQELGDRLADDELKMGAVPDFAGFMTAGVDRQVDHWVYWIQAWGKWRTGSLVNYGIASTWDEVVKELDRGYDGINPVLTLVDSGFEQSDTYEKCLASTKPGRFIMPCKGVESLGSGEAYQRRLLDLTGSKGPPKTRMNKRRGLSGSWVVHICTNYYQAMIQQIIDHFVAGQEGSLTIPADARRDQDLLEQLLNECISTSIDDRQYEKRKWVRINEMIPNDFRDTWRYASCAADIATRNAWGRVIPRSKVPTAQPPKRQEPKKKFIRRGSAGRRGGIIRR